MRPCPRSTNALPVADDKMHISLIVFAGKYNEQKIVQPLSGDRATLLAARRTMPFYRGWTYMMPAVRNARSALSGGRAGVPKVLLMLTDGEPNDAPGSEFRAAKGAGVKVMMVLIGTGIQSSSVSSWVSSPASTNVIALRPGFSAPKFIFGIFSAHADGACRRRTPRARSCWRVASERPR